MPISRYLDWLHTENRQNSQEQPQWYADSIDSMWLNIERRKKNLIIKLIKPHRSNEGEKKIGQPIKRAIVLFFPTIAF